jgi:hypothetical protein
MQYSFIHRDKAGDTLNEFIKLDARFRTGQLKLLPGETLLATNNLNGNHILLESNDAISDFLNNEYMQVEKWDPLDEHRELRDNQPVPFLKSIVPTINPQHYQGYFKDFQWFEVMQDVLPDVDSAALSMVYKYLARSGKKDDKLQEALKALWYLKFYTARLIAGRNISVAEIEGLLNSVK